MVDDRLREVLRHIDAHFLPGIVLRVGNDGRQYFLAYQYDADNRQDVYGVLPGQVVRHDELVDGIHRLVEDNGIDLSDERTDESQDEGQHHQPLVGLDIRLYFLEEDNQIHDFFFLVILL